MKKPFSSLIALLFMLGMTTYSYSYSDSRLLGCWQETEAPATVLCYQDNSKIFFKQLSYQAHGTWSSDKHNITIDFSRLTLNFEVLWLSDDEHSVKSTGNGEVSTFKKIANQVPRPPKRKLNKQNKESARDIAQDIAEMVTKQKNKVLGQLDGDVLLKTPHCDAQHNPAFKPSLFKALNDKGVTNANDLVDTFFSLICKAKQLSANSKVITNQSFMTSSSFYSGAKKLGDWPCDITQDSSESNNISFFGIFLSSNQVSRWTVVNNQEVDVWLAPFLTGPSDSNLLKMTFDDNRWQLRSVCYSNRL